MSFQQEQQAVFEKLRKEQQEYVEACEDWAEQGFRPKYCFHGTYMWTDYDNICGMCESDEHGWIDQYSSEDEVWEYAKVLVEENRREQAAREEREAEKRETIRRIVMDAEAMMGVPRSPEAIEKLITSTCAMLR